MRVILETNVSRPSIVLVDRRVCLNTGRHRNLPAISLRSPLVSLKSGIFCDTCVVISRLRLFQ